MEHKISDTVHVNFTNEYDRFKMIDGNRQLNQAKINKIMKDIEDGIDVLRYYPIQVFESNGRLEIKDGQHRFYISRKLKKPVFYILMKDDRTILDIAKINSNVEKWKTGDFLRSHVQLGNKHYEALRDFMEKYGLATTLSTRLLASGIPGGDKRYHSSSDDFQRGSFEVKFLNEATALADACSLFKNFRHWKAAAFFSAVHKIMSYGKVDIMEIAINFEKYPDDLQPQAGFKGYITALETLFNKKKHNRVIIYEDKKPDADD